MVTHGHPAPVSSTELIGCPPPALAAVAELGEELEPWALDAHKAGVRLFGDVGWDPTGVWSPTRLDNLQYFHAFMPNQHEAMAFTGQRQPLGGALLPGGQGAGRRRHPRRPGGHGRGLRNGRRGVGAVAAGVRLRSHRCGRLFRCGLHRGLPGRAGRWATGCGSPTSAPPWPSRRSAARWPHPAGGTSPTGGSGPTPGRNGRAVSGFGATASWRTSSVMSRRKRSGGRRRPSRTFVATR